MRVQDQKSVGSVAGARNARGAVGTGARFSLGASTAAGRAESLAPTAILGGLEALIALQSEDTARERRKRGARRGHGLLDLLDELKVALLAGRLPPELQGRVGLLLRESGPTGDPRLDGILDGIELRAEVEMAKLRQARVA